MHRHLNSLVKVKQASFFVVLKELIIEQETTENKLLQPLYCDSTVDVEDEMKEIFNRYSEYYGVEFLKKNAFNFH